MDAERKKKLTYLHEHGAPMKIVKNPDGTLTYCLKLGDDLITMGDMIEWAPGLKPRKTEGQWTKDRIEEYTRRNVEIYLRYYSSVVNFLFTSQIKRAVMTELAKDYGIDRTEIGRILKRVEQEQL